MDLPSANSFENRPPPASLKATKMNFREQTNRDLEGRNMQTIIVLLNPGMLENADLDLRYRIPDRIEEVSNSLIQSNVP